MRYRVAAGTSEVTVCVGIRADSSEMPTRVGAAVPARGAMEAPKPPPGMFRADSSELPTTACGADAAAVPAGLGAASTKVPACVCDGSPLAADACGAIEFNFRISVLCGMSLSWSTYP